MMPETEENPTGLDDPDLAEAINRDMLNANACQLLGRIKGQKRGRGRGASRQKIATNQAALDLLFACDVAAGIILLFSHLLGGTLRKRHGTVFEQSRILVARYAAAWAEPNAKFERRTLSHVARVYAKARLLPGESLKAGDSRKQVIKLRSDSTYRKLVERLHAEKKDPTIFF